MRDIYEEMLSYLSQANEEQLAEDYMEIIADKEGPLAFDYINYALHLSQGQIYLSNNGSIQPTKSNISEDFSSSAYCLAA